MHSPSKSYCALYMESVISPVISGGGTGSTVPKLSMSLKFVLVVLDELVSRWQTVINHLDGPLGFGSKMLVRSQAQGRSRSPK